MTWLEQALLLVVTVVEYPHLRFPKAPAVTAEPLTHKLILLRQEVFLLRFQSLAVTVAAPLLVTMVGEGLTYLLIPVPSMPLLRPGILFTSMLRRLAEMEAAQRRVLQDKAVTPRFP